MRKAPNTDIALWEKFNDGGNKVSMNYTLMNTPNINNAHIFSNINFNITEHGGKGIFLNTNLVKIPILNLSSVYELRNTFNATKLNNGNSNTEYTVDFNSAKTAEGMFKDCSAFRSVFINNNEGLKLANAMFKDNTVILVIDAGNMSNLIEGNSLCAGCESLIDMSNSLNFSNSEFVDNVFLNCKVLSKFYNIGLQNSKIVSGIYQGCENLRDITWVSNDDSDLDLSNANIINNLFKDCTNLMNVNNHKIIIPNNKDVQADNIFDGCASLISQVPFSSYNNIVSSACMYNDCVSLTGNITNNMSNSTNTSAMYKNCANITSYTEGVNQSNISSSKFENCINLSNGTFFAGNAKFTANMFKKCIKLNNNNINTLSGGTCTSSYDVSGMFEECVNITSTPSIFDSSNAELLVGTFKGCRNLQSLNVNLNNAKRANVMVQGCTSLSNLNLTIDSSKNFTHFPNLELRGTNISIENFADIASKLPNMSKYIGNGNNLASGLTWTKPNNVYDFQEVLIGYDTTSTMYYSNSFKLYPGEYKLKITRGENEAACIVKMDETGLYTVCAMNPFVYTCGFSDEITVMIDEESYYRIFTSSIEMTESLNNYISLTWSAPYYTIDIRNTPADDTSSSTVQNAINTLNNKGWQVKCNSLMMTMSLFEDEITEEYRYNYMDGINAIDKFNDLNTLNLEYDNYENDIEPKVMITETFEIPAGYYNLFSQDNMNDNFIVYKVTDIGEYPIAMSYDNEFSLCFEINEKSYIKIQYNNDSNNIILKKM